MYSSTLSCSLNIFLQLRIQLKFNRNLPWSKRVVLKRRRKKLRRRKRLCFGSADFCQLDHSKSYPRILVKFCGRTKV